MQKPVKILHVPRRFVTEEWGGSETFISEIALRQKMRGMDPEILTTLALSEVREEVHRGVPVRRFSYFYPYVGLSTAAKAALDKKAGNLFSFSLMRALTRGPKPDLIHLHTGKRLGGIIRYYAVKHKIPYVISLHGGKLAVPTDEQSTWTEPTKGACEWGRVLGMWVGSRRVLEDAAAIICVGKDEFDAVSKQYPAKIVLYLPNGVDVDRFAEGSGSSFRKKYSIPEDRFVCLTSARVDVQKNQIGLVKALREVSPELPNLHLLFLGAVTNPEYLKKIQDFLAAEKLADRVTIIPGLSYQSRELVDAYHAADCFVLPSLHEPFGMVILEAWAAGLPVAASNRGGIPGIITHGENGILFQPEPESGAQDDSLAEALRFLYHQTEAVSAYGEAGKKLARQQYSWDAVEASLFAIYRRIYAGSLS